MEYFLTSDEKTRWKTFAKSKKCLSIDGIAVRILTYTYHAYILSEYRQARRQKNPRTMLLLSSLWTQYLPRARRNGCETFLLNTNTDSARVNTSLLELRMHTASCGLLFEITRFLQVVRASHVRLVRPLWRVAIQPGRDTGPLS